MSYSIINKTFVLVWKPLQRINMMGRINNLVTETGSLVYVYNNKVLYKGRGEV